MTKTSSHRSKGTYWLRGLCLFGLLSCSGAEPTGPATPPPVANITVAFPRASLRVGETMQAAATIVDANGALLSGRTVTWTSSAEAIVTVSASGLVTAVAPGTATITASSEGKSGGAGLGVTVVPIASIAVSLPRVTIRVGETVQASASALDSAGKALSGRQLTWASSNIGAATVSNTGLVTAVAPGSATINASSEGKTGGAGLSITVVPVATITVSEASATLFVGQAHPLTATAKDSAGNTLADRPITWSVSDTTLATVSQTGIVVGKAAGTADVSASVEGKSGVSRIQVLALASSVPVANVVVTVPRTSFRVGEPIQAAAIPVDSAGGVLTGREITWLSSDPDIATVSPGGVILGVQSGTVAISAQVSGKTGSVSVSLSLVPVSTVSVTPSAETISSGASIVFQAILKDSANRVLSGRSISWRSGDVQVAAVDQGGSVIGKAVGTTKVSASAEGKEGQASITINTINTPVATVLINAGSLYVAGGGKKVLTATLRDASGNVLGGRTITWSSSNPEWATIDANGLLTANVVDAPFSVTATSEGKSGIVALDVVNLVKLSAGGTVTCGLNSAGTAYCWGSNSAGQLGIGNYAVAPRGLNRVATSQKFVVLSAGSDHVCALSTDGSPYCWGGVGFRGKYENVPTLMPGGYRYVSIAAGASDDCATTSTKQLYCWGLSETQSEYDIYQSFSTLPTKLADNIVAVVASPASDRYCGVDGTGLPYCWGPLRYTYFNNYRQSYPPTLVSSSVHFASLRVGAYHSCGLTDAGDAYCFGSNSRGQLGDGTFIDRDAPVKVANGLHFIAIAAGGTHSCGLIDDGTAYCWGNNDRGQIGVGSSAPSFTLPQKVSASIKFTGIRGGTSHTCGLIIGGPAYCWGDNLWAQLGEPTVTSSSVPIPAVGSQ